MNPETKIANTREDLFVFLEETLERSAFKIEEVALSSQEEWVNHKGILGHKSGGYFAVVGCQNTVTREEDLILYQPQRALNGLAVHRRDGRIYVLLHARIEPGNVGVCHYGPTIQSTPANYMRVHNGKAIPYLNYFLDFDPKARQLWSSNQLDLGKRYFQKSKTLSYVELDEMVPTADCMIWADLKVVFETIHLSNFMTIDLRSMLALFDWDAFQGEISRAEDLTGMEESGSMLLQTSGTDPHMRMVPISELTNWRWFENGIEDMDSTGVSARMYKVSCTNREVAIWHQPLMYSEQRGESVLLSRTVNNQQQVLLSFDNEFGVPGELVVFPTFYCYPGESIRLSEVEGVVLSEMMQCEEGGRFFLTECHYRVVEVDPKFEASAGQVWVGLDALKRILQTSNRVSIQLRQMASMVLLSTGSQVRKTQQTAVMG